MLNSKKPLLIKTLLVNLIIIALSIIQPLIYTQDFIQHYSFNELLTRLSIFDIFLLVLIFGSATLCIVSALIHFQKVIAKKSVAKFRRIRNITFLIQILLFVIEIIIILYAIKGADIGR